MAGLKHDEGKLDWHALPLELVELLVPVAVNGANKYGRHSILQTIEDAGPRHYSATMRHLSACQLDPLAIDPESGCYHAVHAAYDLLARVYQCEGRQEREEVPEMNAAFKAQGLEAMDTLASACGYIIPQMDDGGDDAYSGNISCPGCGRAFPLGTKQAERVQLYGVCVICKYKTRPVPQADKEGPIMEASAEEYAALVRERQTAAESSGYTLPPLDDGDDDPAVHVVPDRTSRSGDDATASQMYERHKREMEQYRSND